MIHTEQKMDRKHNAKFCDFKEGVNCYAVSDEHELAELLDSDVDISKVIINARKTT
jgi:hypothetical protein